MSDVNKVASNAGVQYGFEDTVARQMAEEAVEIANETGSDIADLKSAIDEMGGGGQPVSITLASSMTDESKIYLYLGEETGYTYGHVYAYVNSEWEDTGLYGRGQNGADGYSPTASITSTSTGATISITDKNGTTTANITNGTATQEQVDAWLDDHPEATTTVTDGSITTAKLASNIAESVNTANNLSKAFDTYPILIGLGEIVPIQFGVEYYPYTDHNGREVLQFLDANKTPIKLADGSSLGGGFRTGGYPYNSDANYGYYYDCRLTKNQSHFKVENTTVTSYNSAASPTTVSFDLASTPAFVRLGIATNIGATGTTTKLWTVGKWYTYGSISNDTIHLTLNDDNLIGYYEQLDSHIEEYIPHSETIKNLNSNKLSTKFRYSGVSSEDSDLNIHTWANMATAASHMNDGMRIVNGEIVSATGYCMTKEPFYVKPNTEIAMVAKAPTLFFFDYYMNYIGSYAPNQTFTVPENAYYMHAVIGQAWGAYAWECLGGVKTNFRCTSAKLYYSDMIVDMSNDNYTQLSNFLGSGTGEVSRIITSKAIQSMNHMRQAWRIASFNTYIGNRNRWTELKEFLQNYGIDIIGLQEVSQPLNTNSAGLTFEQALTSWNLSQFAVIQTEDSPTNCRPVGATSEFEVVSIEETKYTTQSNYGHRHFTKTQLKLPRWKDKKASENFMVSVYNTQLEVGTGTNNTTRLAQANELLATVAEDTNPFVVIMGDFNEMSTGWDTINLIRNAGFTPQLADTSTPTAGRGFYDFIFVNDRMNIVDNDVIPYDLHNNISDHDLVFADVVFDYSNLISVKTSLPNCTLTGGGYWLDRRQTEPVVYTVVPDTGYIVSSIATGQGDNDLTYNNGAVVKSGNTVTITPNLVVGDVWINVTTTASS